MEVHRGQTTDLPVNHKWQDSLVYWMNCQHIHKTTCLIVADWLQTQWKVYTVWYLSTVRS